ncbi:ATP-binding protein [Actinomycetospora sp. C-140]
MELRILGPLEAVDAQGAPVDLGGARERTLLAVLLVARGRIVAAPRLADELWGDHPPAGAAHALRVHVSRLRRCLRAGGADGALVTRAPGYVLALPRPCSDADRFDDLIARARADEDRAAAAALLREALGLWRGPVLGDLPAAAEAPALRAEADRLEEARLAALEDRIDADLACGRHRELAGELDALTRAHPLRERLSGQRMLALYRAGRQAEALAAHDDLRRRLADELGIDPGPAATALRTAILRQDPSLDGQDARPAPPPPTTPSTSRPPTLLTEMGPVFVGRDDELARLREVCLDGRAQGPRLVLIAGEPGVGKTRLAAELGREVAADGGTVLAGRCDEDLAVPYQPFVEALRGQLAPGPARAGDLGRLAGELVRLVPEIGRAFPDLPPPLRADPETERYRLFEAVAAWLAHAAADRPVLLLLDDLHWATTPTLQLLRHLTRAAAPGLVVVATYRDTETTRDDPLGALLADLRRQPGVERVTLRGLDAAAVADLVAEASDDTTDTADVADLARTVHAETEGVPFFVRELLRHLAESGALDDRQGGWRLEDVGLPEGVREVMGRRLSRLHADTLGVLRLAAVVGPEFDPDLVRDAGGLGEETVLTALDDATAARLVIESDGLRYRFAHTLVRATLTDDLTGARRATWHRRIAEALERRGDTDTQLEALAHHWSRAPADPGSRRRAAGYAARAGERAGAQLAHDEAVRSLRAAVDLLPGGDEDGRVALLVSLGEAQRRAGHAAHRQTLLAAAGLARSRGDADGLARAAIANSPGSKPSVFGVTDADRVATLEAAVAMAGAHDSAVRARLLAVLALELFHVGDRDRRLALSDEALAIARRLGDPRTLGHVLVARPFAIGGPDTLAARLADTAELLDVARRLDEPVTVHRAWWLRFRVAAEVGDAAEADRCLDAQDALMAEIGQPTLRWMTGLQHVARHLRRGELDDADRLLHDVAERGRVAEQEDALLYHAIQLFALRREQGRVGDAEALVARVAAASPELPAIHAALGVLHAETGRDDEARRILDAIAGDDLAALPVEASTMVAYLFCADLCVALDDRRRAAQLVDLLAPHDDQVAVWAVGLGTGAVAAALGRLTALLGDTAGADAHFARALEVEARAGAPSWSVRTRRDRAALASRAC